MPSAHAIWQLRQCSRPSMVTRHSKQMPMPHSGRARLAGHRAAEQSRSRQRHRRRDHGAGRHGDGLAVHRQRHLVSHARASSCRRPGRYGSMGMAQGRPSSWPATSFAGGQRRRDAQAFVAGGQIEPRMPGTRADERQLVRRGGAEAGPARGWPKVPPVRACIPRARLQHAAQDGRIDGGMLRAELARRADQHLAGAPRLHVESHRIGGGGMRALQISQLDKLMTHEAGIAVRDRQVALSVCALRCRASAPAPTRRWRSP